MAQTNWLPYFLDKYNVDYLSYAVTMVLQNWFEDFKTFGCGGKSFALLVLQVVYIKDKAPWILKLSQKNF